MWKPINEVPKDAECFLAYKPNAKKYKTVLVYPKGEYLFDSSSRRITDTTHFFMIPEPPKE